MPLNTGICKDERVQHQGTPKIKTPCLQRSTQPGREHPQAPTQRCPQAGHRALPPSGFRQQRGDCSVPRTRGQRAEMLGLSSGRLLSTLAGLARGICLRDVIEFCGGKWIKGPEMEKFGNHNKAGIETLHNLILLRTLGTNRLIPGRPGTEISGRPGEGVMFIQLDRCCLPLPSS